MSYWLLYNNGIVNGKAEIPDLDDAINDKVESLDLDAMVNDKDETLDLDDGINDNTEISDSNNVVNHLISLGYVEVDKDTFDAAEPEAILDPSLEKVSQSKRIASLEEALNIADEVAIELYEMQSKQDAINEAQDEALIELYEMIGG